MNNRYELNKDLAQMLKGGVIMDVTTPEQAKIAEAAGACAVMALDRVGGISLKLEIPTSHTTVRTVRYTAVQST